MDNSKQERNYKKIKKDKRQPARSYPIQFLWLQEIPTIYEPISLLPTDPSFMFPCKKGTQIQTGFFSTSSFDKITVVGKRKKKDYFHEQEKHLKTHTLRKAKISSCGLVTHVQCTIKLMCEIPAVHLVPSGRECFHKSTLTQICGLNCSQCQGSPAVCMEFLRHHCL